MLMQSRVALFTALPVLSFANQEGLDMLETMLLTLEPISLEKILDEHERRSFFTEFRQIMKQGFASVEWGMCLSSMGSSVSYQRAVAWGRWLMKNKMLTASATCLLTGLHMK
ncbi:hypothetical protein Hanom_Chr16g01434391 [Helianthus anomalus]